MWLVIDKNLKQHVEEPTRGPNIFDLVLSEEDEFIDLVAIKKIGNHNTKEFQIPPHWLVGEPEKI